jgi:hypothetical protein
MKTLITVLIALTLSAHAQTYHFKSKNGTPLTLHLYEGDVGPLIHAKIDFPSGVILGIELETLYGPHEDHAVLSPTQAKLLHAIAEAELNLSTYTLDAIDPVTGKKVVYAISRERNVIQLETEVHK